MQKTVICILPPHLGNNIRVKGDTIQGAQAAAIECINLNKFQLRAKKDVSPDLRELYFKEKKQQTE